MKSRSLKNRFALYISITIVLIAQICSFVFAYYDYKKDIKKFHNKVDEIFENALPVYENYLWKLDFKSLNNFIDSFINTQPYICGVSLLNERGKVICHKNRVSDFCKNKKFLQTITKNISHNGVYLGKITFNLAESHIKKEFYHFD